MTDDQAMSALGRANTIRSARAEDKRRMRRREGPYVADLIRRPPPHWAHARLAEVLLTLPRIGRVKAQRWCELEGTGLEIVMSRLKPRQREMLARHVDTYAESREDLRHFVREGR
jgi:hypothetical protein